MNWDVIQGNWDQFKGVVRQKWGKLTDQDLEVLKGKRDEAAGYLQERLGLKKEDVQREIERMADSFAQKMKKPEMTH